MKIRFVLLVILCLFAANGCVSGRLGRDRTKYTVLETTNGTLNNSTKNRVFDILRGYYSTI